MPDITIRRGYLKAAVISHTAKGRMWLMTNKVLDGREATLNFLFDDELATEMIALMRNAGLDVEVE